MNTYDLDNNQYDNYNNTDNEDYSYNNAMAYIVLVGALSLFFLQGCSKFMCNNYKKTKHIKKHRLLDISYSDIEQNLNEKTCCICLSDYKNTDKELCKLSCNHIFHKDCIYKWSKKKNICPLCRVEFYIK
jgi:hypothetical protein